jgi:molybdopterin molybdotransferase
MVTVRLPTMLRTYAGDLESIEVEAETVAGALEAVVADHPDAGPRLIADDGLFHNHLAVFVGERPVERDDSPGAAVEPGDTIRVLVAIAGGADVRMKGFRDRATVEEARAAALDGVEPLPAEAVGVTDSAGRVLAGPVVSGADIPPFRRATMDGYAVHAEETFGASLYNPIELAVAGESMPGVAPPDTVAPGTACRIMTGAPVPEGADAVLRAEDAEEAGGRVEVRAAVARGRNIGRIGEDVTAGTEVLAAGRRLLPQDVALLASLGHDPVEVRRRPLVRVIVSGNELVPPGQAPGDSKIVDSNSPMLEALVARDGGVVESVRRLPDGEEPMRAALSDPGADVIITAGAASVGREDYTPLLVAQLGELPVHGVAMRPSSPTGVGRIGGAPVLLLPGNPVSCLVAYDFFAGPVIRRMGGLPEEWPYPTVRLPLGGRLASQIGRTDYARVAIRDEMAFPLAVAGASILSSVTRADGFVMVPAGSEGYGEGSEVEVRLYRGRSS